MIKSLFFKKTLNKVTFRSKKLKFFLKIFKSIKTLKKKKLNIHNFLFFIILKLKPIFRIVKNKINTKKKKKKNVKKKSKKIPKYITNLNGYKTAIKWFLLPLYLNWKKRYKYNFLLEFCFYVFIDKKKKNVAIIRKKAIYYTALKNKKFFRLLIKKN